MNIIRHGDLGLVEIKKLPKDLKPSKTKILMIGNTGNHHSFDNGVFYEKQEGQNIIGYFEAKNTTLFHNDHGEIKGQTREVKLEDGIYEVRRQNEETIDGMKPVVD